MRAPNVIPASDATSPQIDCDNNKILIVVYTAIHNFRYR